jgi:hypothetical protein
MLSCSIAIAMPPWNAKCDIIDTSARANSSVLSR